MGRLFALIFLCTAFAARAQTFDTSATLALKYFKEAEIAGKNQQIWKAPLYGPTLFVEPVTRATYANEPDSAGILKPEAGIFKGVLPKDVMIANTSIRWQDKMWSVILWPLPTTPDERISLVLHESFHRIQNDIGFSQRSPTADHLSSMNGRIYFLLELRALSAALAKPVTNRRDDISNALLFREKRHQLFPATYKNEEILEMNEGIAEYTGMILGREKNNIRSHLFHQLDTAGQRKSLIRSSAYITGPVYGYLLYEKFPGWTQQVDSNSNFPELVSNYYHTGLRQKASETAIAEIIRKYNGAAIINTEKLNEQKRQLMASNYIRLFTQKPVLTIKLEKMGISFNPNTLFDLGKSGTVYPTAEVKDVWGKLTVSAVGMLMKDWKIISLPASEELKQDGQLIEGNGWKLTLNDHWKLTKIDPLHFELIKKSSP